MTKLRYSFERLPEKDAYLWDIYLDEIDSSTFFHGYDWIDFVRNQFNIRLEKYVILNDANHIVGLFPYFKKNVPFLNIVGSPLVAENFPYLGFILKDSVDMESFFESFELFVNRNKIDFLRLSFDHFHFKDSFEKKCYNIKEKKSFRISMSQDIEALWRGIGSKGRNLVRKAEKNSFTFSTMCFDDFKEHYFNMSLDVYKKQKISPILSQDYYTNLYEKFYDTSRFEVYCVKNINGQSVAAAIILNDKDRAYYLDGVSYRSYQMYGINNYLQWNIINELKKKNTEVYDLLGGDIDGIAKFKLSFGSVNYPCLYVDKSVSTLASMSKIIYSTMKSGKKKFKYYLGSLKS